MIYSKSHPKSIALAQRLDWDRLVAASDSLRQDLSSKNITIDRRNEYPDLRMMSTSAGIYPCLTDLHGVEYEKLMNEIFNGNTGSSK